MKKALAVVAVIVAVAAAPSAWRWLKRTLGAMVVLVLASCAHANTIPAKNTVTATATAGPTPTFLVLTARSAKVGGQEIKIGLPPLTVWLVAEVKGPPAEKLYCPEIAWIFPNGTEDTEESECAAWEMTEEFPRRWSKGLILGTPGREPYHFVVEARRGNVVIARAQTDVQVYGDVGGMVGQ